MESERSESRNIYEERRKEIRNKKRETVKHRKIMRG